AAGAPGLRQDFAYRAAHVSALAAKALIADYYGQGPAYSYFDGCSDGGREGLVEAQRYAGDFAGVVAGAPAIWITPGVVRILWESRALSDPQGGAVFTAHSAALLHEAVLQSCDALDGLKDGQIDEPRACHFDPRQLLCRAGQSADSCLTPAQVEAARQLYQGPVDAQGRALYPGGQAYGTELDWIGSGAVAQLGPSLAAPQIRNMILEGAAAPINWRTWALDADHVRLLLDKGDFYDAAPRLQDFRQAGGKLLLWQGTADAAIGPNVLLDYYQRLRDAAGSLAAARNFARAFMVPGVSHCGGGYVPYDGPLLPALVNWVEQGTAPEQISFTATLADGTSRTRPVYAYPLRARYDGHGDINSAASFHAEAPPIEPDDHYDWVGVRPPQPDRPATGDLHRTYRFPGTGASLPFRLYVPQGYAASRPSALVVILHGYGASADSVFDEAPAALARTVQREAERHGFIVLAPSGNDGRGDYGAHLPLPAIRNLSIPHDARQDDLAAAEVLAAIGQVQRDYRIDPDRVFLMGNSMGMTGTLQLAQQYPARWCAIGPSDGPPWPDYPVARLGGLAGAIFVNGDRDTLALTAVNRALAERLRATGVDTRFVAEPAGEHGTAWYLALPQIFDYFAGRHCPHR
ncbi:MAG TPA: tannase/feruloyl esterase family alpha/beta hydrolase, partial [Steroidobacteraceae bacterium]|nr:tannase/feruloyl esterase family alpha/beta hydrolase [Steroidobacteraceae bacterium]